mgnify:CR=1 FL=1
MDLVAFYGESPFYLSHNFEYFYSVVHAMPVRNPYHTRAMTQSQPTTASGRDASLTPYRKTTAIFKNPRGNYAKKYNRLKRRALPKGRHATNVKNIAKFTNGNIGSVYTTSLGSNIGKGTDFGQRIGNRIFVKSFTAQYMITNTSTSIADNLWVRMFLVLDLFSNTLITTDMWTSHGDTFAPVDYDNTGNTLQLIDRFNPQRFVVLFDRRFSCKVNRNEGDTTHDTILIDQCISINRWLTFNDSVTASEALRPLMKFGYFFEGDDDAAPKAPASEIIHVDGRQYIDFINP